MKNTDFQEKATWIKHIEVTIGLVRKVGIKKEFREKLERKSTIYIDLAKLLFLGQF